jgi:hypothetical protein
MILADMLVESHDLDTALKTGWVRLRYVRRDGMARIMMATTNPDLYQYTFKRARTIHRLYPRLITVWERNRGWRALYRHRIGGWKLA